MNVHIFTKPYQHLGGIPLKMACFQLMDGEHTKKFKVGKGNSISQHYSYSVKYLHSV